MQNAKKSIEVFDRVYSTQHSPIHPLQCFPHRDQMLTVLISSCEAQARLSISTAAYESEKVNYKSPLKVSLTRLSLLLDLVDFIHHKQNAVSIETETTGQCSLRIRGEGNTVVLRRKNVAKRL
ncbi:hypothetical protein HNY73_005605 [Argiope bruennichi]|uniref:Uncharacterized protein n=1 Tax=Argiope bruennichi TaxID=94029 RepID=A0A8T0FM14_ARGBR|nr:hypothetical protein HNY73_005605 [Argiope bruennichi]